ncbi:MAG: hypothetical protein AAGJ52_06690 [Pseudomonadota bacterium]
MAQRQIADLNHGVVGFFAWLAAFYGLDSCFAAARGFNVKGAGLNPRATLLNFVRVANKTKRF